MSLFHYTIREIGVGKGVEKERPEAIDPRPTVYKIDYSFFRYPHRD